MTLIEIVLSPRLSLASTSNATTVSTDVPPFDSATDGGRLVGQRVGGGRRLSARAGNNDDERRYCSEGDYASALIHMSRHLRLLSGWETRQRAIAIVDDVRRDENQEIALLLATCV